MLADFCSPIDGLCESGIVTVDVAVTVAPVGEMPEAVPMLVMLPRSTSSCVVVYVAVHVSDSPGSRVDDGQVIADRPGRGSVTSTECSVTLPVLVTGVARR